MKEVNKPLAILSWNLYSMFVFQMRNEHSLAAGVQLYTGTLTLIIEYCYFEIWIILTETTYVGEIERMGKNVLVGHTIIG